MQDGKPDFSQGGGDLGAPPGTQNLLCEADAGRTVPTLPNSLAHSGQARSLSSTRFVCEAREWLLPSPQSPGLQHLSPEQ